MRRVWLLTAVLPLLCGFTCGHVQSEGHYLLTTDEVIEDPCQLLMSGTPLGTGTLTILGDQLRIDDFNFQGTTMQQVGSYQQNVESFYLDGSAANAIAPVNGQTCNVDLLSVDVQAVTDDATHFHGTLRVSAYAPQHPACTCQAGLSYHAVQQ